VLQSNAEIEFKTHRKVVLELLTRPAARLLWQPNLESAKLRRGEAGQVGALTSLRFNSDGRTRRVEESILSMDPHSSLHVMQLSGGDEYHFYYGFYNLRPGYLKTTLTIEFNPGSALGSLRGYFNKKIDSLADEQLNLLNEFVIEQNSKRKERRIRRKAAAEAA